MRLVIAACASFAVGLPFAAGADDWSSIESDRSSSAIAPAGPFSAVAETGEKKRAQPPPKSAEDLSRALLPKEDWDEALDRYATSLAGHVSQLLASGGEPVPNDLTANVRKQLGERLPYAQMLDRQSEALAARFTADELKQAAEFYSSKLGKKVLRELQHAQEEVGEFLQTRLTAIVPEVVQQVAPKALQSPPKSQEPENPANPPRARRPPPSGTRP